MNLFPHQITGAGWLGHHPRAYLGDEPGLGKTRTLIAGLNVTGSANPLIVCPAIVRSHWLREFETCKWGRTPLVKSYDEITDGGFPLMAQLILKERIDTLVPDEAHYAKHTTAKRTQILFGRDGYARRLERVWLASGTPMPKSPSELYTQLCTLIPEELVRRGLTSQGKWDARFTIKRGAYMRGRWIEKVVAQQNVEELKEILAGVMLRRTLDDVGIEVPELMWQTLRLDLEHPDADADFNTTYEDGLDVRHALNVGNSLADIANDPHVARMRRRLGELKVEPTAAWIYNQLSQGDEKIVVFAHHRTVLARLRDYLGPFGVCYIDGDTPPRQRDLVIDRFQHDASRRVFVGQNIACQTGITLHASRRVILVEPDWTAVVNYQLGKRVARIGSSASSCIAQMVALAGTLDEAIVGQNLRETRMAAEIFRT